MTRDTMTDAGELYRALVASGRLSGLRRLTYRCGPRGCLLLQAVETPLGVLLHQDRYKYSEGENLARSSEDGRRANTYDGGRHWREQSYWLSTSALAWPDDVPAPRLGVSCDHVLDHHVTAPEFRDDWQARHAEVRVRPDGSRYVLH